MLCRDYLGILLEMKENYSLGSSPKSRLLNVTFLVGIYCKRLYVAVSSSRETLLPRKFWWTPILSVSVIKIPFIWLILGLVVACLLISFWKVSISPAGFL